MFSALQFRLPPLRASLEPRVDEIDINFCRSVQAESWVNLPAQRQTVDFQIVLLCPPLHGSLCLFHLTHFKAKPSYTSYTMDLLRRPSTRSTGSNRSISPTPTLVETPPSPTNSYTIQIYDIGNGRNSTDRSDVDSIWNVDFQESWEQRRLEDEAAAEELKTNAPVLLGAGFSVSPGQSMSRRSSRQGSKKSNPNTARSSRVSSTNNLSLAAQPLPPDLQQHRSFIGAMNHTRRQLRSLMRLKRFHLIMIALVGFDLMIVMVEVGLLLSV